MEITDSAHGLRILTRFYPQHQEFAKETLLHKRRMWLVPQCLFRTLESLRPLWIFLFVFFGVSHAVAGLEWETRSLEVGIDPHQKQVEVEFLFRVAQDQPILIQSLTTSCDCLKASLGKRKFAPGDRGTLRAIFDIGQRVGEHRKKILVLTDANQAPDVLTLSINIPQPIKVTTPVLVWTARESAEQPIGIQVDAAFPGVQIQRVELQSKEFAFKVKGELPSAKPEIFVTPSRTRKTGVAILRLHTNYPDFAPQTHTVQLRAVATR